MFSVSYKLAIPTRISLLNFGSTKKKGWGEFTAYPAILHFIALRNRNYNSFPSARANVINFTASNVFEFRYFFYKPLSCIIEITYNLSSGNLEWVSRRRGGLWTRSVPVARTQPRRGGDNPILVKVVGLEPTISWTQTKRFSQTKLHPENFYLHLNLTPDVM